MDGDPRVCQLLEELLDSERTPEEVCHRYPELLPEVHRRWQRKRACDAQLDAFFLTREPHSLIGGSSSTTSSAELPRIPGYEVLEVVGRGGMGVVYRARHVRLDRPVALKMLLTGAHASRESRERFAREARIGAGLRHPNIVQVHDMGDQDGLPYFTMEFVEGGNLAQKLAGAPLPPHQAAALLATLAEAVQAAHRCGIVHRDLKPANILFTADGTPKICDLGLARRLNGEADLTWTGATVGTPSYMAPEQAETRPETLGPAVDIHALGAILYELLTGRPPFRAATAAETVRQLISQDPAPPSRLNGKVPRDLETICLKCLRREPRLRYAGAAALAEDLHRFLDGEAIAARPEGRLARLARRVRGRTARSTLVAAVTLLTVALLGGGLWLISDRAAAAWKMEMEGADTARPAIDAPVDAEGALARGEERPGTTEVPAGRARVARYSAPPGRHSPDVTRHGRRSHRLVRADRSREEAFREGRSTSSAARPRASRRSSRPRISGMLCWSLPTTGLSTPGIRAAGAGPRTWPVEPAGTRRAIALASSTPRSGRTRRRRALVDRGAVVLGVVGGGDATPVGERRKLIAEHPRAGWRILKQEDRRSVLRAGLTVEYRVRRPSPFCEARPALGRWNGPPGRASAPWPRPASRAPGGRTSASWLFSAQRFELSRSPAFGWISRREPAASRASPAVNSDAPSSTRSLSRNCPGNADKAGNPPRLGSQPGVVNRKLSVVRNMTEARALPTAEPIAQTGRAAMSKAMAISTAPSNAENAPTLTSRYTQPIRGLFATSGLMPSAS